MHESRGWPDYTGMFKSRSPLENITYEFDLTSPAVPSIFYSFYLNGLWDGR